ncbi:MAG: hypothetical protein JRH20_31305, partial [Deltaproteobacteria bacterium]|nr:hypothetical protein [Deltaproteobacteria bacterium]
KKEGRKLWTRAVLRSADGDVVYSEAEGIFVELDDTQLRELATHAPELKAMLGRF